MITECAIYMAILGAIALVLAIWCSHLYTKNSELQHKSDQNELSRVEAEGEARRIIIENERLFNELKDCKRKRDNKGRYIHK